MQIKGDWGIPQQAFCNAKMVFVYTKTLLAGRCFPSTTASEIFKSLQLCKDIVCAHAAGKQLFQHIRCFSFLCGFRCVGFSLDLFSFDSGDFLVDGFQFSFLGFQVCFQGIDISGDGCDFSSGFLSGLLFSELCSKVNGCFYRSSCDDSYASAYAAKVFYDIGNTRLRNGK